MNSHKSKTEWEQTGFPAIATSLGLLWGGTFNSYDPVHFEWTPSTWGKNADQYLEQGLSGNAGYDTEYSGTTTKEYREIDAQIGYDRADESTIEEDAAAEIAYWNDQMSEEQDYDYADDLASDSSGTSIDPTLIDPEDY